MSTQPRWYFNLMITPGPRLGMLDHITTTTTVCLKSKRQNVSISYMKLKEMHSLPLTLVLVHVLMDSSSLCHAFTYTNMIFSLLFQLQFPLPVKFSAIIILCAKILSFIMKNAFMIVESENTFKWIWHSKRQFHKDNKICKMIIHCHLRILILKSQPKYLGWEVNFKEYLVSQVILQSKNCEEDPLRIIEFKLKLHHNHFYWF